jgi:hypothetical protein
MAPGRRPSSSSALDRWKLQSSTAPNGASAATASIAAIEARPINLDDSTSGTGRTDISASLMVSLATSGSPSSAASGTARVVFPLPGGPETTMYTAPAPVMSTSSRPHQLRPPSGDSGQVEGLRKADGHRMESATLRRAERYDDRWIVNIRTPTSRSRCATAGRRGRGHGSHPGAVRAANGTRVVRRSQSRPRERPHALP